MPELIRQRTGVRARVAHSCRTCSAVAIAVGETYTRDTLVHDGRVYDWIQCDPCSELSAAVYDWCSQPDDGIGLDEYVEWAREHADHPEHGPAARAYLARLDNRQEPTP